MHYCSIAVSVWNLISGRVFTRNFFSTNLRDWLSFNISSTTVIEDCSWPIFFGATLVSMWHQRNELVFPLVNPSPSKLVWRIRRLANDIIRSYKVGMTLCGSQGPNPTHSAIAWKSPPEGCFKLNCEGALSTRGNATCGGVLRSHTGEVIFFLCEGYWHMLSRAGRALGYFV